MQKTVRKKRAKSCHANMQKPCQNHVMQTCKTHAKTMQNHVMQKPCKNHAKTVQTPCIHHAKTMQNRANTMSKSCHAKTMQNRANTVQTPCKHHAKPCMSKSCKNKMSCHANMQKPCKHAKTMQHAARTLASTQAGAAGRLRRQARQELNTSGTCVEVCWNWQPLSLEGDSQMAYIVPERLTALVRPAFDLVLRRIRSLKRCVQA